MSFSKVLHGKRKWWWPWHSQVFIYQKFVRQGKIPLFFHASGQGTSRDPRESDWVMWLLYWGHCVYISYAQNGQFIFFHWKTFKIGTVGAEGVINLTKSEHFCKSSGFLKLKTEKKLLFFINPSKWVCSTGTKLL